MRRTVLLALSLALLSNNAPRGQDAAPNADAARAIVLRAVKAHGGEEKLTRHRADKVKLKGSLLLGQKAIPFTGEVSVQLPGQLKNALSLDLDGKRVALVQVLNGDAIHVTLDGQPQKVEGNALAEMRDKMQLARAVRLVPLLADRNYTLAPLPPGKVGERAVDGIKITAKGQREIRMFFEREKGLLVKTEMPLTDNTGRELGKEEHVYDDFRDLAGFVRPVKMTASRNNMKVMEAELTEVKYYERLDDAEFAKP